MTITFRNNIGAYTGKGSPLTSLEADGNIHDHELRLLDLEEAGAGRSISSITSDGVSLTITFSDSTTAGPFAMPVATFNPAGEWLNATTYQRYDVVSVSGTGFFLVLEAHTTAASGSFDPEATGGSDEPLYQQIGGVVDPQSSVQTQSSATWTLAFSDRNTYNRCTHVAGCTVTVPDDTDVEFNTGDEVHIRADTAGLVTIQGGSTDVVINSPHPDEDTILPWQGATITLKKIGVNEWDYIGLGTENTA